MPNATVSLEAERFPLKTLDEGYVELKPMSFGQKLRRQEMVTGDARLKQVKGEKDQEMAMEILQRAATEYEFKHCIVGHNLTDANDLELNFKDPRTLDNLHPRVGDEIANLISSMNNFDEEDEDVEPGKA